MSHAVRGYWISTDVLICDSDIWYRQIVQVH